MKKMLAVIGAAALGAALQTAARADDAGGGGLMRDTGDAIKRGADATGDAIKRGAEATGSALGITETEKQRYETIAQGDHRVTGTISALDQQSGELSLATDRGTMQLHFPPDSLTGLSKGDRLTVALAYALPDQAGQKQAEGRTERRQQAGDQPMRGEHWLKGTVSKVDTATGMVDVKTDAAPLKVQFPPSEVSDIKSGEEIAIQLAFERSATGTGMGETGESGSTGGSGAGMGAHPGDTGSGSTGSGSGSGAEEDTGY